MEIDAGRSNPERPTRSEVVPRLPKWLVRVVRALVPPELGSEIAARAAIDNVPSAEVVRNLVRLAEGLEFVRLALENNPIHITSGYRSARLNQLVGGSKNSMHIQGLAADILCPAFGPPLEVCRAIAKSGIAADQIIHEFGHWCHVAFPGPGQTARKELLTIRTLGTGAELGLRGA